MVSNIIKIDMRFYDREKEIERLRDIRCLLYTSARGDELYNGV